MQISNAKIKPKELVQISLKTKDLNIVENRISLKDIKYKKLLSYVIKKKKEIDLSYLKRTLNCVCTAD